MNGNFLIALRYLASPGPIQSFKNHLGFLGASILKPQFTISKVSEAFSEARAIHHIYWNLILTILAFSILNLGSIALNLADFSLFEFVGFPVFIVATVWIAYAVFYAFSVFILHSQSSTRRHIAGFSALTSVATAIAITFAVPVYFSSGALRGSLLAIAIAPLTFLFNYAISQCLNPNPLRANLSLRISLVTLGAGVVAILGVAIVPLFQSDSQSTDKIQEILADRTAVKLHCEGRISLGKELMGCVQFPELKQADQERLTKSYCEKYVEGGKVQSGPCPIQQVTSTCRSNLGGAEIYSYDETETLKVHCSDLKMGTFVVLGPDENSHQ